MGKFIDRGLQVRQAQLLQMQNKMLEDQANKAQGLPPRKRSWLARLFEPRR